MLNLNNLLLLQIFKHKGSRLPARSDYIRELLMGQPEINPHLALLLYPEYLV
jgi:hypothetical protein